MAGFTLFVKKKKKQKKTKKKKNTHFVGEALFYPKTEVMGFP